MSEHVRQEDIAIRIHSSQADILDRAVRDAFPEIEIARGPLESERALRMLVTFYPPEDEDLSKYDWVHCVGAGVDGICKAFEGVSLEPLVTRTTGRMGQQIGEYCAGYGLAHLQKMAKRRELASARDWDREAAAPAYVFETPVAVIGTGSIGQGVARAFSAMGAPVTGLSRTGKAVDGFDKVIALERLSKELGAKILIGALPLTPETDSVIGESAFAQLEGALFINVGRGATLDEDALKAALDAGQVSHAVLDVFRDEPLSPESWLWAHGSVTVTPHVSGLTRPEEGVARLLELLKRRLAGETITSDVDISRGY